jgi:5-methylcytosine-specific restriction protein A
LQHRPRLLSDSDAEVVELSEVLNALPIHTVRPDAEKFRNPNGVAM